MVSLYSNLIPRWVLGPTARSLVSVSAALALLNVSVTFRNVWPTLSVRPTLELSLELAAVLVVLAAFQRRKKIVSLTVVRSLTIFWMFLIVGRYIEITTRSLYGRDVNLYWDFRHVPSVGAMFATVAEPWLVILGAGVAILVPVVVYFVSRWAFTQVAKSVSSPGVRVAVSALGVVIFVLYGFTKIGGRVAEGIRFSDPVVSAYARESFEFVYELTGAGVAALGEAPTIDSSLVNVEGADVFVVFMESYGAVSWEEPSLSEPLVASRSSLESDILETGRNVVSAMVESTTFGGESWLAHISLLSGTEVRDDRTNVRLMAQDRDTLVKLFGRNGYRTVAIVPGLLVAWPEGAFYGFDEIYDYDRLGYKGPPFGWWSVNDQYALARVDSMEISPLGRNPRFVFFSTISTHAPFTPAPPYQADWTRVLGVEPYDEIELHEAWSDQPDWLNLGPSYVKALRYSYSMIGGYLRLRAERDLVMILVGDHQPPALVSGESASWNVPVHIVSSREVLLDRFRAHGFGGGLSPGRVAVARMDSLLPILLDGFGSP